MGRPKAIWKHERCQADRISRYLLEPKKGPSQWWRLMLPSGLASCLSFRRSLRTTRKNLLFTKGLAFKAAKDVIDGEDRALALGAIERTTQGLLDRERLGLYTEKIRRKQLAEIEILLEHYLKLLRTEGSRLEDLVRACYKDRKAYLSYLGRLHEAEQGVIQASIATVRKGSKNERIRWFQSLGALSKQMREEDVERFFPEL